MTQRWYRPGDGRRSLARPLRLGPLTRALRPLLDLGGAVCWRPATSLAAITTITSAWWGSTTPITAAGLLGLGEARYRVDEDGAAPTWEEVLRLPDTPWTYRARGLAAARVRSGDLPGAIAAYREADRRAPAADKPEIATRLGWLTKETGDPAGARRYFAKGRGDGPPISRHVIIGGDGHRVADGLPLVDGQALPRRLHARQGRRRDGEYWRLWTVTLLHGNLLHLFFNMYALFLVGPIVERWYGSIRSSPSTSCAPPRARSAASSSAAASRRGRFGRDLRPVRDRAGCGASPPSARSGRAGPSSADGRADRINLVFGFASGGVIDNAAHIGGLIAGLWIGYFIVPTKVATMSAAWTVPGRQPGVATAPGGPVVNPTPDGNRTVPGAVRAGDPDRRARRGSADRCRHLGRRAGDGCHGEQRGRRLDRRDLLPRLTAQSLSIAQRKPTLPAAPGSWVNGASSVRWDANLGMTRYVGTCRAREEGG